MIQVVIYIAIAVIFIGVTLWAYLRGKEKGGIEQHEICQEFINRISDAVEKTLDDDERKVFLENLIQDTLFELVGDDRDD